MGRPSSVVIVIRLALAGAKVFLDLHAAMREGWREDERFLGELEWPLQ
jgi:hypothetical protein